MKVENIIKSAFKFVFSYQYSKLLILMESGMVCISTNRVLEFCEMSIESGYTGTLPYLTTLIGAIWAAYGVSVAFYYGKSKGEEIAKINLGAGQAEERDEI